MKAIARLLPLFLACLFACTVLAEVPRVMTFQGKLTDPQGHVLDGNHKLTFRIYNQETGGGVLWQEVHNATAVTKGIFAVPLGATTPLNLPFDTPYWVSIEVGTDGEMSPRQRLTSAPYSLRADKASQADAATHAASSDTATHATTADSLTTPVVGLPPGTILAYGGTNAPTGFFPCDGRALSSITYPQLFAALGTNWGAGDGTLDPQGRATDFRLPDLRGRFLRGVDGGTARDPDRNSRVASNAGGNTGNAVGSVQGDEFRSHSHLVPMGGGPGPNLAPTYVPATWDGDIIREPKAASDPNGGSETRPINANVNHIIKY